MEALSHRTDGELVVFVIDEIERFSKMTLEERREVSKPPDWPLMFQIPNAHGISLVCGREAARALSELSGRVWRRNTKIRERCSADFVYKFYIKYLLRSIVENLIDGVLDEDKFAKKYGNSIFRIVRRNLRNHKFGIPCVLPIDLENNWPYTVGPIAFVQAEKWVADLSAANPEKSRFSDAFSHDLRGYSSIAFVTIVNCDSERGRHLAEAAVEAAINIIRIFLVLVDAASDIDRLGHAKGRLPPSKTAWIEFLDGAPVPCFSRASFPYVGEGFLDFLNRHAEFIQSFAQAIIPIVEGREATPQGIRFLDALNWFGDACLEGNSGSQIVKAVMCFERLVIYGDESPGLKNRVSKRIAAICAQYAGAQYEPTKIEVSLAYAARSDLMHGSFGPRDAKFAISPGKVLKLAALALFSFGGLVGSIAPIRRTESGLRETLMDLVKQLEQPLE